MKKIVAFDFDGTLTNRDTLLMFILDAKGLVAFTIGFLYRLPLIIMMKLRLYPNYRAKEKVFSYFFKGMPLDTFNTLCQRFADTHRHLLRPQAVETLKQAQADGAEVLIISASIDNWVQPFFPSVKVLGTQIEVKDGCLTGNFLTKNCYGQEKVNRILEVYPHRDEYHLTAYGDSNGDKELLAFADEAHFKPFRV
ncbi:MAG: haloacid dehalogenase-like hydrolase [Prevotella sp.]|nr:haloacid dehalogenase-like hydrolase [Prevotella sp.]